MCRLLAGSTNLKQISEANTAQNLGLTILAAKDHPEAFLMVETGRAAAFVISFGASMLVKRLQAKIAVR